MSTGPTRTTKYISFNKSYHIDIDDLQILYNNFLKFTDNEGDKSEIIIQLELKNENNEFENYADFKDFLSNKNLSTIKSIVFKRKLFTDGIDSSDYIKFNFNAFEIYKVVKIKISGKSENILYLENEIENFFENNIISNFNWKFRIILLLVMLVSYSGYLPVFLAANIITISNFILVNIFPAVGSISTNSDSIDSVQNIMIAIIYVLLAYFLPFRAFSKFKRFVLTYNGKEHPIILTSQGIRGVTYKLISIIASIIGIYLYIISIIPS